MKQRNVDKRILAGYNSAIEVNKINVLKDRVRYSPSYKRGASSAERSSR